jgi:hypothetical protein
MPAKSPAFSMTGPEVTTKLVPMAFARIFARVVFPRPGGPLKRQWPLLCSPDHHLQPVSNGILADEFIQRLGTERDLVLIFLMRKRRFDEMIGHDSADSRIPYIPK